jgi:hypothetical protein
MTKPGSLEAHTTANPALSVIAAHPALRVTIH